MTAQQPGPLGEEAVRLVEAMSQWVSAHAGDLPLATGSAECRVCPVCQVLAMVRHTRPEVFGHLADATSSFVAAVRTAVETSQREHGGAGRGVERIDLDEDAPNHSDPNHRNGAAR